MVGTGQQRHGVRSTNEPKVNYTDSIHNSSPVLQTELFRGSSAQFETGSRRFSQITSLKYSIFPANYCIHYLCFYLICWNKFEHSPCEAVIKSESYISHQLVKSVWHWSLVMVFPKGCSVTEGCLGEDKRINPTIWGQWGVLGIFKSAGEVCPLWTWTPQQNQLHPDIGVIPIHS